VHHAGDCALRAGQGTAPSPPPAPSFIRSLVLYRFL
jgi:hypothetical protein